LAFPFSGAAVIFSFTDPSSNTPAEHQQQSADAHGIHASVRVYLADPTKPCMENYSVTLDIVVENTWEDNLARPSRSAIENSGEPRLRSKRRDLGPLHPRSQGLPIQKADLGRIYSESLAHFERKV
jgi:hypothetical protein